MRVYYVEMWAVCALYAIIEYFILLAVTFMNKRWCRYVIRGMCILITGGACVWAQTSGDPATISYDGLLSELGANFMAGLETLVKMLQVIWMIPAILAGKLLTNEFVFGQGFGLERYLFAFWQVSKTISLFILGFLFLWFVLLSFFRQEPASLIKNYLPKIFLATVLIHVSFFAMRMLVDISTIGIVATGQITSSILDTTGDVSITPVHVQFNDNGTPIVEKSEEETYTIQKMLETGNDMSGPLLFFGHTVLRLFEYGNVSTHTSQEAHPTVLIIRVVLALLFVIPLVLLIVVNFVRIFWIWMYVCLGPIIVLDLVFDGPLAKGQLRSFKLSNIIGLIMQPVAVVGVLSIATIFSASMVYVMKTIDGRNQQTLQSMFQLSSDGEYSTVDAGGLGKVTVKMNIVDDVSDLAGGTFGYLVVAGMTVFLIWSLIKVGFATNEATKQLTDTTLGFAQNMITSLPILPIAGGASIGAVTSGIANTGRNLTAVRAGQQKAAVERSLNSLTNQSRDVFVPEEIIKPADFNRPERENVAQGWNTLSRRLQESESEVTLAGNPSFRASVSRLLTATMSIPSVQDNLIPILGLNSSEDKQKLENIVSNPDRFHDFMQNPTGVGSNAQDVRNKLLVMIDDLVKGQDISAINAGSIQEGLNTTPDPYNTLYISGDWRTRVG